MAMTSATQVLHDQIGERVACIEVEVVPARQLDVARARNSLERAREKLRAEEESQDALEALWRAEARLQAAGESGLTAD